jgi:hypothetical protein
LARHGDTPIPDATWSAFAAVSQPGGPIGGRARYAQYRVDVATADPNVTPAVEDVTLSYALVVAPPPVPQVDVTVSADQGTPQTTVRTAAFSTTAANELLLAFVAADGPAPGGGKTRVNGVTGGGLTWTLVARSNGNLGDSEIWSASAPAVLTNVSVTATLNRSVASSLTVVGFVNASGTGATAIAGASSGAPAATLVTTANNSLVFGVGNDWSHAIARTPGADQVLVHQYLAPVDDTYWMQRVVPAVALGGTSVTLNDVAPTGDRWNLAVVEILAR